MLGTSDLQQNLFKTRLTELINMEHPLVKLAGEISWDKIEAEFEGLFSKEGRKTLYCDSQNSRNTSVKGDV